MMTRLYKIFFLLIVFLCLSFFLKQNAWAIGLLPPGPVSPTVDGPTDVQFSLKGIGSAATNIQAQASTYMQEQTKLIKAAKKKYMDKFTGFMGGLFKKKEKKAIAGTKEIKETKIADIYDPESVYKAMYKLFLAYPSKKQDLMTCYRNKSVEFYQDTVIEVYTSVRQLETQLKELEVEINGLSEKLVAGKGGDGAESNEDDIGVWKNYYTAFETMDELLQITEELMAMKAQYEAARTVSQSIEPAAKGDKQSSLLDGKIADNEIVLAENKAVVRTFGEKIVLAQALSKNTSAVKLQTAASKTLNSSRKSFGTAKQKASASVQPVQQKIQAENTIALQQVNKTLNKAETAVLSKTESNLTKTAELKTKPLLKQSEQPKKLATLKADGVGLVTTSALEQATVVEPLKAEKFSADKLSADAAPITKLSAASKNVSATVGSVSNIAKQTSIQMPSSKTSAKKATAVKTSGTLKTTSSPALGLIMRTPASRAEQEADALARQRINFEAENNLTRTVSLNTSSAEEEEDDEDYEYDPANNGFMDFVDAPPSNMKSPFAGNEEKMAELEKLNPVYEKAQEAMEVHNLMKSLPSYREMFEQYEQMKKLHEQSLKVLKDADQCSIQFLGRYYNNPEKVWTGKTISDDQINEYDLRSGISGWAIKSFEVAKAEQTSPVSMDDFGETEVDVDIDNSDLASVEKNKSKYENQSTGGLANPSKEEELEKVNRETSMMNWKIGAEAASLIVQDQYGGKPQWGTPSKKFPIWNDQKTFYTQYIDGKYNNIKEYLKNVDVNDVAIEIAFKLNDLVQDAKERAYNTQELNKLSSLITQKRNGEETVSASTLQTLLDSKEKSLEEAKQSKETRLAGLLNQKEAINAKIDKASQYIKTYNQRINQLSQEAMEAQNEQETLNDLVKRMEEEEAEDDKELYYTVKEEEEFDVEITPETEKETVEYETELKVNTQKLPAAASVAKAASAVTAQKAAKVTTEASKNLKQIKKTEKVAVKSIDTEKLQRRENLKNQMKNELNAISKDNASYSEFDDLEAAAPVLEKAVGKVNNSFRKRAVSPLEKQSFYRHFETIALADVLKRDQVSAFKMNALESVEQINEEAQARNAAKAELKDALSSRRPFAKETATTISLQTSDAVPTKTEYKTITKLETAVVEGKPITKIQKALPENASLAGVTEASPVQASVQKMYTPITKEITKTEIQEAEIKTYTRQVEKKESYTYDEDGLQMKTAKESISESEKVAATAGKNKESLRKDVKTKEAEIAKLQEELKSVEDKIKSVEQAYNVQVQLIESNYATDVAEAKEKIEQGRAAKQVVSLLELYNNDIKTTFKNALGLVVPSPVLSILSETDTIVEDTRNYAVSAVEKARSDIMNLGDELYTPKSNKLVVKRHAELMDELKNLPVEQLSSISGAVKAISGKPDIIGLVTGVYQQAMVNQACGGDSCKSADDEYFVGIVGKERDFKAPKAIPEEYLPPLREFTFFDDTDYDNVTRLADNSITKDGFINSGSKMPEIWKLMLRPHAFVEKDIDLSTALALGGENLTFMRGGILPCRTEGKILDINPDGMYVVYKDDGSDIPECKELKLEGKSGLLGKTSYNVIDIAENVKGQAIAKDKAVNIGTTLSPKWITPQPDSVNPSELGVLLRAGDNNIYFNTSAAKVFEKLASAQKEMSTAGNQYEANLEDEAFKRSLLKQNQIGNFLNFVELEKGYRQAKEELAISIEEAKATLFETLKKVGFTPNENLNLANKDDYELVQGQLDRLKNKLVADGYDGMEEIKTTDNAVVEERLEKLQRILGALRKDKDELISISEMTPSDAELDEQIKSEEVNKKVNDEYSNKAKEAFEKQLAAFPRPYCASY